jgi:hypothetical protein
MEEFVQGVVTKMGAMTVVKVIIGKMVNVTRYAYSYNQNDQTIIVFRLEQKRRSVSSEL